MTKNMTLFCCIIFSLSFHCMSVAFDVLRPLRWLKQRFTGRPVVTRSVGIAEIKGQNISVPITETKMQHSKRDITFENNIPDFFDALKDEPAYKDLPNLIDQAIIVEGKSIAPGTSSVLTIHDNQCLVTIRLYKGIAKLIYSMEHGTLRGILLRLLKHIEPWIQWQYHLVCNISPDVDLVQLSDIILQAYTQAQDSGAVNHRFKWVLVVELSLNKELTI